MDAFPMAFPPKYTVLKIRMLLFWTLSFYQNGIHYLKHSDTSGIRLVEIRWWVILVDKYKEANMHYIYHSIDKAENPQVASLIQISNKNRKNVFSEISHVSWALTV